MRTVDEPVFLVGSIRSGTTLLRLMLDSHPDIACNLESEYLVSQLPDAGGFPDMAAFRAWLRGDRVFRHSCFEIDDRLDYVGLANDFLAQKMTRDGKRMVGATVHLDYARLPRIWPRAKYIYLYRDGRDVADSIMRMGLAGNVYVASDWWLRDEAEWQRLRATLPADRWIELRYEDLVADPAGSLTRLCGFLGVAYSERMFDYTRHSSYKKPDPRLTYQWKRKMKPADLGLLEARIGSLLAHRGYEPSGVPPRHVGWLGERLIRLHSRLGAMVFRMNKFGLGLTVQEFLSRRLGLRRWNLLAVSRMDKIVDEHLQ